MNIHELRNKLAELDFDPKELKLKKKPELKEIYENVLKSQKMLEVVEKTPDVVDRLVATEPTETKNIQGEEVGEEAPLPTDVAWTAYVLKHFTDDELEKENPKVDGLRRVAEKLLGPFNLKTDVVQVPDIEGRATVVVTLEFIKERRIVQAAADVSSVNTVAEFARHPVATAETRAEGRALRKALRLTRVWAAEELQNADSDEPSGNDGRITTSMLSSLKAMCFSRKVDLDRLVRMHFKTERADDLTMGQGKQVGDILYKYGKDGIPEEVLV